MARRFLFVLSLALGCSSAPPPAGVRVTSVWEALEGFGVAGSPTLCDLDHDGHLEAIVPISAQVPVPGYVVAYDAATGRVRWRSPKDGTYFAYPFCADADGDHVDDVLLGTIRGDAVHVLGSDIVALSGKDGHVVWSYQAENAGALRGIPYAIVASAPDAPVLFVTAGGDQFADDTPGIARVPGELLAIDPRGHRIASWPSPGGREIYAAPALARDGERSSVLALGTGGESLTGTLELVRWSDASSTFAPIASVASSCDTGGFVASPAMADVTGDGAPEVVGADFCGGVVAVDLAGNVAWRAHGTTHALANPLAIRTERDGGLDVIGAFSTFDPTREAETLETGESDVVAFDGRTGDVRWTFHLGGIVTASPVAADVDGDGGEDVLVLAWRLPTWRPKDTVPSSGAIKHGIFAWLRGRDGALLRSADVGNMWGTPALGDVDGDGSLDVLLTDASFATGLARVMVLGFPDAPFDPRAAFGGFRGPSHTGLR